MSNALEHTEQIEKTFELEQTLEEIRGRVQIIGQSPAFLKAMKRVRDYAGTDFPVLITGESGIGKDLVALALHNLSARREKPFVVQNCSAIPETLLERLEKAYVEHLLHKNNWVVTRAAKDAGINRSTFDSRMKKLGIYK